MSLIHFPLSPKALRLKRYPATTNRSLRAWSAADEHLLRYVEDNSLSPEGAMIWHDRFGVLGTVLQAYAPISVISYHSQSKALRQNLQLNGWEVKEEHWVNPLHEWESLRSLALMKIPKSVDLFHLYLHQLHQGLQEAGTVVASFMTRHFSKQWLEIAATYFEEVQQSQAWKKSRLLILKGKKPLPEQSFLRSIEWPEHNALKQYAGTFSSQHLDYATQFLLPALQLPDSREKILDLACGNGILGLAALQQAPGAELHLVEDAFLSVESARLNLLEAAAHVHWQDDLSRFENGFFDYVVSNPPFHLEHENNIEVAIQLFKDTHRCLRPGGIFQLVASRHLNFSTHLHRLFEQVEATAQNEKFEVISCVR
ncbi:MAG: methyltransferase [Bacteroidota bacterium]